MALLGLLPLLLWAGCRIPLSGWDAPARVLWWFVLLGEGLCLAGIAGQMEWSHLLEPEAVQLARLPRVPLYAEYLLWPLLMEEPAPRRILFLPWLTFLAQVCLAGGICLVFGGTDYPEQELLRAWSVGIFSRMDALLLLIWLFSVSASSAQRQVSCGKKLQTAGKEQQDEAAAPAFNRHAFAGGLVLAVSPL